MRLLTRDVPRGREALRTLLAGPLQFTPIVEPRRRGYRFTGTVALGRVIEGVITDESAGSGGVPNGSGTIFRNRLGCAVGGVESVLTATEDYRRIRERSRNTNGSTPSLKS
jgi:hypothetical protein